MPGFRAFERDANMGEPRLQNDKLPTKHRPTLTGIYVKAKTDSRSETNESAVWSARCSSRCPGCNYLTRRSVEPWAQLEVLADQAYAELREGGILNRKSDPRRLLGDFRMLRQTQATLSRELGMTPAARMALKATGTKTGLDLAGLMAAHDGEATRQRAQPWA